MMPITARLETALQQREWVWSFSHRGSNPVTFGLQSNYLQNGIQNSSRMIFGDQYGVFWTQIWTYDLGLC